MTIENPKQVNAEDDDRWCTICGRDDNTCQCEIGPQLNNPDGEDAQDDEEDL